MAVAKRSRGHRPGKLFKQSSAIVRRLKSNLGPAATVVQGSQEITFDDDGMLTSQHEIRKCPRPSIKKVRFNSSGADSTPLPIASDATKRSVASILSTGHDVAIDAAHFAPRVLHIDHLPGWMRADPYIKCGYRRESNSFRECFESLFYPHNEFVNTWSHLLPAFFFLAVLLETDYLVFYGAEVSWADSMIVQTYVAGTAACLVLSVCLFPQQCLRLCSEESHTWPPVYDTTDIALIGAISRDEFAL